MTSSALIERSLGAPTTGLREYLAAFIQVDLGRLDGAQQEALLQEVAQGQSMLASLRLRILASAEKSQAAARSGAASTGQWAARIANTDHAESQRQVALAQDLELRTATQEALSAGRLTPAHASVIVNADRNLPSGVSAQDRARVEAALVEKARVLDPAALRRVARRALAEIEDDDRVVDRHENELVAAEEVSARARTRLVLHDNNDGTISGHFTIPTTQGQLLRKVLETMTAPRRGRLGASEAQVGDRSERTDWAHARGMAFTELIEHLPTDHLHPRTAATLVVTFDEDVLRGALRAAGVDTGGSITAGELRRLACSARLIPAVFGGATLPLDLGRSSRLFSDAQRTAIGLKHDTCAADGCERPFAWCELHHLQPWARGGRTDLADAVPLCHFHHRRIHDDSFVHRRSPAGAISFVRRS